MIREDLSLASIPIQGFYRKLIEQIIRLISICWNNSKWDADFLCLDNADKLVKILEILTNRLQKYTSKQVRVLVLMKLYGPSLIY